MRAKAICNFEISYRPRTAVIYGRCVLRVFLRYAWGVIDCCDLLDPSAFTSKPCIANCPIMGSSGLPANPFIAKTKGNGQCECVAPQECSSI